MLLEEAKKKEKKIFWKWSLDWTFWKAPAIIKRSELSKMERSAVVAGYFIRDQSSPFFYRAERFLKKSVERTLVLTPFRLSYLVENAIELAGLSFLCSNQLIKYNKNYLLKLIQDKLSFSSFVFVSSRGLVLWFLFYRYNMRSFSETGASVRLDFPWVLKILVCLPLTIFFQEDWSSDLYFWDITCEIFRDWCFRENDVSAILMFPRVAEM